MNRKALRGTGLGAAVVASWWLGAVRGAARDGLVLVTPTQRVEIGIRSDAQSHRVPLRALAEKLGLTARIQGSTLTITAADRELAVSERKNIATVAGEMKLLSAPCTVESNDWWVPADSLEGLLGPLLRTAVRYRAAQRALLVGEVSLPRVVVRRAASADGEQVLVTATGAVTFGVSRLPGRVTVAFGTDLVDVVIEGTESPTAIVEGVHVEQGTDPLLVVDLGPGLMDFRSSQPNTGQLVLDFGGAPAASGAPSPSQPGTPTTPRLHTIVIDPGHGGFDNGAVASGGLTEKALTLRLAQQLRASLISSMGLQVILTREDDKDVDIDARAGIANNFKAQFFVSLHAGSKASGGIPGPQVFTRAIADEVVPAGPAVTGLASWTTAQAAHVAAAASVAVELQARLARAHGHGRSGPRAAPLRVLAGASMPAVLVELGCVDDSVDAGRLTSDAGQKAIVAAFVDVLSRYVPVAGNR